MSIFTYNALKKFYKKVKTTTKTMPLCEWNGGPGLILRHDVDLDIMPAYRMALLERESGIRSTFFILLTADTYNPSSPKNRKILREMDKLGFEIGLHFDPVVYETNDLLSLTQEVQKETQILADIIGRDIHSISLHNPSVHGQYFQFEGFLNAYDKRIFAEDRYLSDSRMIFRIDPYDFLKSIKGKTAQLLLHPLHYSESGREYPWPMLEYMHYLSSEIDANFSVNSTYRQKVHKSLFECFKEAKF